MNFTAAEAKMRLLELCRQAADDQTKVYIRDKAGRLAVTIDPNSVENTVAVTAQFFKDHFARCTALTKTGVSFCVSLRGNSSVYIRRHHRYTDALDVVVNEWINGLRKTAAREAVSTLALKLNSLEAQLEFVSEGTEAIKKGLQRIEIGHKPFQEGKLRHSVDTE